jgi:hypothetical protein
MSEYFIVTNSFAAPFVSDQDTSFAQGESPAEALESAVASYKHPAGLFAADCYESATDYHKGKSPLARWLCNHEIARQAATKDKGAYSYMGLCPGQFEINGELVVVEGDPKAGRLVEVPGGEV